MNIEKTNFGYIVYIKFKSIKSFRIEVDMEFGVNFSAPGSLDKENAKALIEGIEMAYKLYSKEISIGES